MVLPDGWYLTGSSIPAAVTELPDGRIRLDLWNPRPDSIDVLIKAKRSVPAPPERHGSAQAAWDSPRKDSTRE